MRTRYSVAAAAACGIISVAGTAQGAGPFERVYHSTETALPGAPAGLEGFGGVNLEGSTATFAAYKTGYTGIFEAVGGGFRNVVDTTTIIPSLGTPLTIINFPSVSGSSMAFMTRAPGLIDSIYTADAGGVRQLVPPGVPDPFDPTRTVRMTVGSAVSYADERVAFYDPTGSGFFQFGGGAMSVIAHRGQAIPGTSSTFQYFKDGSLFAHGDTTLFMAGPQTFRDTLWKSTPAGLSAVVAEGDAIPGAPGKTFDDLMTGRMNDRGQIAFFGDGAFVTGVYLADGGVVRRVADDSLTWGGQHVFISYLSESLAMNDRVVLFGAIVGSGSGTDFFLPEMFMADLETGGLSLFLKRGDIVDGRVVASSRVYPNSFDGDRFALGIRFTDGTEGIYVTAVPGPGGAVVLPLAGLAVRRRRR